MKEKKTEPKAKEEEPIRSIQFYRKEMEKMSQRQRIAMMSPEISEEVFRMRTNRIVSYEEQPKSKGTVSVDKGRRRRELEKSEYFLNGGDKANSSYAASEKEPISSLNKEDLERIGRIASMRSLTSRNNYIHKLKEDLMIIDEQLRENPSNRLFQNPLRVFRRQVPSTLL